jgi:hypothetical protein
VAQPVEFTGRDAGLDVRRDEVERLRCETASLAHALEAFGAVKLDRSLVAPPIVDAVVFDVVRILHNPYLACDFGGNKTRDRAWTAGAPPLKS